MNQTKWLEKEDSWANIIGLFLVLSISAFWAFDGFSIVKVLNVKFSTWSGTDILSAFKNLSFLNVAILFCFFGVWLSIVSKFLGKKFKPFIFGFILLFILSILVFLISAHTSAKEYQLESPLVALIIGLILGNFAVLPQWLKDSLLTEFYVKIGIVLMGATLPLTLLVSAGGVAILQACIITIVTFWTIYFAATKLFKLEPSFGATLGAGGSICGVSAAIVIGNAAKAKQEHISLTISIVVLWAVVMVILLPIFCKMLNLDAGVAGAWIGTSEFADSAGLAAAQSIGDERAIAAFTLIKIIGRDMFVGIWAVLVAFLSVTVWHKQENTQVNIGTIWERFPKFILGFLIASVLVSLFTLNLEAIANEHFSKEVLGMIKTLRNWVFTWTFLCIGINTQFRQILLVGYKPLLAFTIGVAVNLPLGFILSSYIFHDFWTEFMK
ncbi:YeiH family protein [Helicobacter turcicus]|uniref:Sulfate exporter family transporter n=1 Tax=Helicobacter turcicus TaxID=2867412 RepID=A0ABS7JQ55_9HELI|nr:putative sulfate exporter family transporter [Helicobacter turcicus]MBX7491527.1 putative sulfate exporter family transporter [Helicobacter turcicus]MBX7546383.1 putative sulfate exporter family transporter [Helicobacter turcicus]